jgi:DNA-binding GntR family transcriptional regulator
MAEAPPMVPERVGETVYRVLRDRILSGAIPSGSHLSVPALAREFGVSRSPVRDAVLRLAKEGLTRETLNRGAVVPRFDRSELFSLYEAREALEGITARLAAPHFSAQLRRRLLGILTEHEQVAAAGDFARHIELDAAFHREVRQAANSPVVARMLEEIQGQVMIAMRSTSVSGGMPQAVEDHRRIFEALAEGNAEASEAAARDHIIRLRELLRAGG